MQIIRDNRILILFLGASGLNFIANPSLVSPALYFLGGCFIYFITKYYFLPVHFKVLTTMKVKGKFLFTWVDNLHFYVILVLSIASLIISGGSILFYIFNYFQIIG